ncbi:MAG: pyridoxine/pyridoxamine 5'-phosphate oxidase [Rhodomicrobium sp.]|nr:MAG: pyridoxine/pyridoxamine 5'-phosphate oxidase [Rhodomicrobium sp.]
MADTPSEKKETSEQGADFLAASAPFTLFGTWLKEAEASELNDPNAMSLATVDVSGLPNVRMVLLKGFSPEGFVFYTNKESAKGREIIANPQAALCFHWKSLRRQVRVRGPLTEVSSAEADDYYNSRPRGSQVGAWASQQSRELESRFALEKRVAKFGTKFAVGEIPRPDYWSGFCLTPLEIEFWHDRPFRLHDRLQFKRSAVDAPFTTAQLYP